MAAMRPLYEFLDVKTDALMKYELQLLDIEIFALMCQFLSEYFQEKQVVSVESFLIGNFEEFSMFNESLAQSVVNDIIESGDYDVQGIARYTDTPIDVIHDIVIGQNKHPSALVMQRLVELHMSVRHSLYANIAKKITSHFLSAAN